MVNYNNSIIYKLCCKDINVKDIYVGSTTNFTKRKQKHKSDCNNENSKNYNFNVYKFIRNNGGWDNWDMVVVERYECNDKLELHKKERDILEQLGATLNMCIPNRSIKEYQKEYQKTDKFKEYQKEYQKEYHKTDKYKEQIKEYLKQKVECKICNKIMNKSSLNRHNKKYHK
jgi:hypothetical protein